MLRPVPCVARPGDVVAIEQLIALHGHLVDDRELHRLGELFTNDAVYDVSALRADSPRAATGCRGS
ncbi:nuclear transport factor 2 family protein [Actinomycetospora sp. NBRC 106375]|uniref:nuclear transport factor 2 family protein n=1 Tax=Actinomycetospora sp. NBRC 106375 TaxID=3032207 RepID=UPI0033243BDF